ncbi:MAG: recombination protein RecR [Bacilli bacterium]|nr:recombination protein RecR [Bacilli bacterium]
MKFPNSLEELIECFKLLPGIGEKNAERLSFAVLQFSEENANKFSTAINNVKTKIVKCEKCNNLTEDSKLCLVCADETRDSSTICVVESTKDLILFEKSNAFKGKYHVLEGLISPLEGINPEDIKINQLINRIKDEDIKEVILALNMSMEGETTALYITKLLEGTDVTVTKIAAGIPVGADMEYLDSLTIQRALEGRNKVS